MERSEGSGPKVNYWSFRVETTKGPWHVTIATEDSQEVAMTQIILFLRIWRPRGSSLAFTGVLALKTAVSSDKSVAFMEDGRVEIAEQVWLDLGYTPELYREVHRWRARYQESSASREG